MRAATFIEILVDQIRDEVREELMQDLSLHAQVDPVAGQTARARAHQASSTELWLSLNLQPKVVPRGAYRAQARAQERTPTRPTSAARPQLAAVHSAPAEKVDRRGSAQTIPQILALEFFKREGTMLTMEFSESEFKSAFRKLALRLHPDRHIDATIDERAALNHRFAQLTEAADELSATLK